MDHAVCLIELATQRLTRRLVLRCLRHLLRRGLVRRRLRCGQRRQRYRENSRGGGAKNNTIGLLHDNHGCASAVPSPELDRRRPDLVRKRSGIAVDLREVDRVGELEPVERAGHQAVAVEVQSGSFVSEDESVILVGVLKFRSFRERVVQGVGDDLSVKRPGRRWVRTGRPRPCRRRRSHGARSAATSSHGW